MVLNGAFLSILLERSRAGMTVPVRATVVEVVVPEACVWMVPVPYVELEGYLPRAQLNWVKVPWKGIGVACCVVAVAYAGWRVGWAGRTARYLHYIWRCVTGRIVDAVSVRANYGRRSALSRYRNGRFMPPVSHSHPVAAGERTGADYAMTDYILTTGAEPYDISSASRNVGDGSRLYYTAKDYHIRYKNSPLNPRHILKMVDVDYYVTADEFSDWLIGGNSALLYTFVPNIAGGPVADGNFTVTGNKVDFVMHGGARYEHELWDWDVDHFTIDTWCGVWVVAVDSLQVSATRRVVQLTPQTWIPAPISLTVPRQPLRKRKLTSDDGKWTVVPRVEKDGCQWVSVARSGTDYAVTLPAAAMESMRVRHVYAKSQRNVGDIQAQLDAFVRKGVVGEGMNSGIAAPLLYEYFEAAERVVVKQLTLGASAPHYAPVEPCMYDEVKTYARVVGPPVVGGASFPGISRNNEVVTIADRVRAPRNTVIPGGKYRRFLNEFLVNLVPRVGGVSPVDASEIMELQTRPAQRARNEHSRTWLYNTRSLVKAFQKKEMGGGVKAARNISTLPTGLNLQYATYVRAFKNTYLKKQNWYVPGMTPPAIAAGVQALCRSSTFVLSSDFSNLDGSKSAFLRDVYRSALLRAFGHDSDLASLLARMTNPRAVTHFGTAYEPGPSQLSGASDTTDNNTTCVGFYVYCCLRTAGFNASDAWLRLQDCLVCGDDVLVVVPPEVATSVSSDLGLSLKVDTIPVGDSVPFLGRVFVDPWTTASSVQDPERTLRKIHTTVTDASIVTPAMALQWKCEGYLVNDRETPVISHYCRNMLRILNCPEVDWVNLPHEVLVDLPWWVQSGILGETPGGVWPQDPTPRFWDVVANRMGRTVGELKQYCELMDRATAFDQVPMLATIVVPVTVTSVVEGELVEAPEAEPRVEAARTLVAAGQANTVEAGVQAGEPRAPTPVGPGGDAPPVDPVNAVRRNARQRRRERQRPAGDAPAV